MIFGFEVRGGGGEREKAQELGRSWGSLGISRFLKGGRQGNVGVGEEMT